MGNVLADHAEVAFSRNVILWGIASSRKPRKVMRKDRDFSLRKRQIRDNVTAPGPKNLRQEHIAMAPQENVQLMRRWFQEVWNEGKTETVRELLAPNAVGIGQAGPQAVIRGPAEFIPFVEQLRGAFPDIHVTVEDVFAADDKVVLRWSATMTHRGDHLGMPATGKPVSSTGITIARIRDGQIVEGWDNWDQLGMWQQIGSYPPIETVPLAKTA
jgi:steroid delta-isomerase-like uncharacterized protein